MNLIFDYLKDSLFIHNVDYECLNKLPLGFFEKHFISEDIFALEQVFNTKNRKQCFFESHEKYIDFELVISCSE